MASKNIVVLGASFAGLGISHYIAKHILPKLEVASKNAKYVLHLVDQSTHFWWHIAAPREIVSTENLPHEKCFIPIADCFKQYPSDSIIFHHATATSLDTESRTVTLTLNGESGGSETLSYDALVIATGVRSPTPLTTLQGSHTLSQSALAEMNTRLKSADSIVISGGGPVGVEVAGEIGAHLAGSNAKITLVTGADKLLPVMKFSRAAKAAKQLQNVGVKVLYKTKVSDSSVGEDGKTTLTLSDGSSLVADVYIPAHGVQPNTEFLPEGWRLGNGYVATNAGSLRVDSAGPRVYAAGDVAGVDRGGILAMHQTLPILGNNLAHDLLKAVDAKEVPAVKAYKFKEVETQLVPVGPKQGVGAFNGIGLPGLMVRKVKGKDYMIGMIGDFTEGKKFVKA